MNDPDGGPTSLRAELSVTRRLSERWFREIGESVVGASILLAVKPVVWYVLFGSLFQAVAALPAFPAGDYRAFILPGIVGLLALEYVTVGGHCVVDDIREGMLGKLWTAPISRTSVVVARVVVMGALNAFQVAVLLAIATLDGVHLETGLAGAAALVGFSVALTAGLTALSLVVAYALKYEFAFSAVTSFLVLPVVFVSNAFVPTALMPGWLRVVADANPLTLAIGGMRTLVLDGWVAADVLPAAAVVVGFALVAGVGAVLAFERPMEPESSLLWTTGDA